jgi:8-oxo-dGTP pyrophosphatase MutT (NUDIX family)
MPSEKSCGAIVFAEPGGERQYLILKHKDGHFDFPKGHMKAGEVEEATAAREVFEETGLELLFIAGFKDKISYFYTREGKKFHKEVIFFLGKAGSQNVIISDEHESFFWLTYEKALSILTFANSKNLLEKAEKFLNSSQP